MATALYRRYRPENFAEMIGQEHVTEPLMTALRNGRIGHAYLFSGPRGCGKTTSARVLARCLNCAEGPTDTPCGTCPSCLELSRDGGGSLDVVEIDAASHGGVDDARDLRERAVFAPARDRYKIFIIDEAHMVTAGGFNALLKIVEEPPPHVKFIFATTEPEKVIGTIRSRTHHYPFRLIAPAALIDYAGGLCASEGVEVEPGVLPLVVRAGGGSVRDTLSILDQLIAGSEDNRVTTARAAGLLGFTSAELLDEVVQALAAGDAAAAFAATDRVVQTGQDPRRFVEDLLERLRDLIVISATSVDGAAAVFRGVPAAQLERMFAQSQAFGRGTLSPMADTVSAALDHMAGATAPRLQLELMIARALTASPVAGGSARAAVAPAGATAPAAQTAATSPTAHAPAPPQAPQAPAAPADSADSGTIGHRAARPPVVQQPVAEAPTGIPGETTGVATAMTGSPAATTAPVGPAVDVISTLRSAREFLRSETAGSGGTPAATSMSMAPAPDPDPAPGTAPVSDTAPSPGAAPVSGTAPSPGAAPASGPTPGPGPAPELEALGLDDLREVWPDLLDELLENDREAWNAVRVVQPLELRDEVLVIGVSSSADLETFKALGASPLREAISAALGVTVRYLPRPVAQSASQSAPGQTTSDQPAAEPPPSDPAEEPEPAGNQPSTPPAASPPATNEEWSEPPAAAWADDVPPEPLEPHEPPIGGPLSAGESTIGEIPGTGEAAAVAISGSSESPAPSEPPAQSEPPAPSEPPEPGTRPAEPPSPPEAPSPERASSPPSFTRYGEAVVREVLGARFIEEQPLPQPGPDAR